MHVNEILGHDRGITRKDLLPFLARAGAPHESAVVLPEPTGEGKCEALVVDVEMQPVASEGVDSLPQEEANSQAVDSFSQQMETPHGGQAETPMEVEPLRDVEEKKGDDMEASPLRTPPSNPADHVFRRMREKGPNLYQTMRNDPMEPPPEPAAAAVSELSTAPNPEEQLKMADAWYLKSVAL